MSILFYPKEVSLNDLYLDPNNYRFIDQNDYKPVSEVRFKEPRIQRDTLKLISGKKNENITDLLLSLTSNGYLPVDQIQVKELPDGGYLVLEGNRRVSALKRLQEYDNEGRDIGVLDSSIFENIPVVCLQGEENKQQILMGIKHITGSKKWPAINQAQFLWDQIYEKNIEEEKLTSSLGISIRKLRQSLRTLAFIKEYRRSDFGDQFETDMYTIFEEFIRTGVLQEWIGWDNVLLKSTNLINRDRLFSWVSEDDQVLGDTTDDNGEIEFEKVKVERIITKYTDIRDLAKFITDEKALEEMEETRSLTQAYAGSDKVKESILQQSIEIVEKQIGNAATNLRLAKTEDRARLKNVLAALTHLVADQGMPEILDNKSVPRHIISNSVKKHFISISIKNYKKLQSFDLTNINKINIIAGINNAGKSTLLEAIYLLTRQNDIYGVFDLFRRRGKLQTLNQLWLNQQEIQNLHISGIFEDLQVSVHLNKTEEEDETLDKNSYLSTLQINTEINNKVNESKARLYKNKDIEVFFKNILMLCNSVYSSPFSQNDENEIILHHSKSIESKQYEKIINFLREKVDGEIVNINLEGDLKRFLVAHQRFGRAVDLTHFGEGMQRMFHVALQFASAENGVLLIDELENAIHYRMLRDFSLLLQRLAEVFNVQVFVTTHSKECIDAFLENGLDNHTISAYRLINEDGHNKCEFISGEDLALLSHSINLDLRGGE
ncbi:ATPase/GTPase, AAA15 family [Paenibacillus sp. yr247]|uniref:AAA family ATPase n=1 Tax=Paenibacillus sp. yr247 TaxID=1761880 RepID=UPI00088478FB|nr:AAA family ATPase [Paenibacillus sp. yr247]SDO57662.1 ATPase/GTPase, AAA15 family [Paenibacillus sp. yr247]